MNQKRKRRGASFTAQTKLHDLTSLSGEISGKKASVVIIDDFVKKHEEAQTEIINNTLNKKAKTRKKRSTKLALKKIRHRGKYRTVLVSLED